MSVVCRIVFKNNIFALISSFFNVIAVVLYMIYYFFQFSVQYFSSFLFKVLPNRDLPFTLHMFMVHMAHQIFNILWLQIFWHHVLVR